MVDEGVLTSLVHSHVAAEHDNEVGGANGFRGIRADHLNGVEVADLVPVRAEYRLETAEVGDVEVTDDDGDSAGRDAQGQSAALITMASVAGLPSLGATYTSGSR